MKKNQRNWLRRDYLATTASGIGALALGSLLKHDGLLADDTPVAQATRVAHFAASAKRCIFIFLASSSLSSAEIDSLKNPLKETHDVDKKIEVYYLLSKKYHSIDLEEARKFADQGLSLSDKTSNDSLRGELFRSLGDISVKKEENKEDNQ